MLINRKDEFKDDLLDRLNVMQKIEFMLENLLIQKKKCNGLSL